MGEDLHEGHRYKAMAMMSIVISGIEGFCQIFFWAILLAKSDKAVASGYNGFSNLLLTLCLLFSICACCNYGLVLTMEPEEGHWAIKLMSFMMLFSLIKGYVFLCMIFMQGVSTNFVNSAGEIVCFIF